MSERPADIMDAEWDALIALTAFDVLWAHVDADVIAEAVEDMDENEREVVQRACAMSAARRFAEGML